MYEKNTDFDTLYWDIEALIEDLKERDGIVKNLATSSTTHRQFEMAIKYLEILKDSK